MRWRHWWNAFVSGLSRRPVLESDAAIMAQAQAHLLSLLAPAWVQRRYGRHVERAEDCCGPTVCLQLGTDLYLMLEPAHQDEGGRQRLHFHVRSIRDGFFSQQHALRMNLHIGADQLACPVDNRVTPWIRIWGAEGLWEDSGMVSLPSLSAEGTSGRRSLRCVIPSETEVYP